MVTRTHSMFKYHALKAVPWTFGELISEQFTVYLSNSVLKAVPWTFGELISAR